MILWDYLFNGVKFDGSMMKNVDLEDPERKSVVIGIIYIFFGLVCIAIYLPFAIAITRHLKVPAYRIMILLSAVDITSIAISGIATGFFCIYGMDYWNYPNLILYFSCTLFGLWFSTALFINMLAFNRCLTMTYPRASEIIFGGRNVWYMAIVIFGIQIFATFFTPVFLFNPFVRSYVVNPYTLYPIQSGQTFENIYHTIINIATCVFLIFLYGIFLCIFACKYKKKASNHPKRDKNGLNLFLQTASMCVVIVITAIVFIIELKINIPPWLVTICHLLYILINGFPAFAFLVFNKTLKDTIKRWFNPLSVTQATIIKNNKSIFNNNKIDAYSSKIVSK